jgi:hypothetical protein
LRDTRDYDPNVQSGESNDMTNLHNTRATSFQTDGTGNDRILMTNTTGWDYPSADVANVLGGTGIDVIVLRNTLPNFPAVDGGESDDTVEVTGPAADPLGREGDLGHYRAHPHIARSTEKIIDFWTFD